MPRLYVCSGGVEAKRWMTQSHELVVVTRTVAEVSSYHEPVHRLSGAELPAM